MILMLGGTAAYFLPLEELLGPLRRADMATPYGAAFPIFLLERYGERVAFASRHGLGRLEVSPPFVNARANIWAAHALGVRRVISWNGVGAINPLLEVHDLLLLDGVLDFTRTRVRSFDDRRPTTDGRPSINACFDAALSSLVYATAAGQPAQRTTGDGQLTSGRIFPRGIYACAEGPRLETASEIRGFRRAGADVVGMTLVPEVFLARELGMAFASLAYVTNYATGVEPAHGAPRFFGVEVGRRCLAVVLAAAEAALGG
ncbi:MAG: MTAP family purine nucleoside phosphorylase [Roseiflexaceae bacterium]